MTANFDLGAVLEVEQEILQQLPAPTATTRVYFKELVAQIFHDAWMTDRTDMRLLMYCFPLIQSMMVKNIHSVRRSQLEEQEIFNTLCLKLLAAFPKYNATRGRIFTFCTMMLHFRIKDVCRNKVDTCPLDDWDMPVGDDSFHLLEDFKAFLIRLDTESGPTASRMLAALLQILSNDDATVKYGYSQGRIKAGIVHLTGLPRVIVHPYYSALLTRWAHSVVD